MARDSSFGTTLVGDETEVVAPMQQMPYEILQEIARHAQPEFPTLGLNRPPLLLSRVSSSWRHVMSSSPEFWATLSLCITHSSLLSVGSKELFDIWCSRLNGLPLALYISTLQPESEIAPASILTSFKRIAPRIRHLGLVGDNLSVNYSQYWPGFDDWEFSALESCDLMSVSNSYTRDSPEPSLPVLRKASSIRKISLLSGIQLVDIPQAPEILQGLNLTHVFIQEYIAIGDWYQMMSCWPNIIIGYFQLYITVDWDNRTNHPSPISLDNLQRLRIGFLDGQDQNFVTIISLFRMLALQDLILVSFTQLNHPPIPDLDPSLFHNFRHIRSLVLADQNSTIIISHWINVLRECVCVEDLGLSTCMKYLGDLVRALTWSDEPSSHSQILPKLSVLCLDFGPDSHQARNDLNVGQLLTMLKSRVALEGGRWPGQCVPLRKLRVASRAYDHPITQVENVVRGDEELRGRLVVEAARRKITRRLLDTSNLWDFPW